MCPTCFSPWKLQHIFLSPSSLRTLCQLPIPVLLCPASHSPPFRICEYDTLSLQCQSYPDLLALSYLSNNKTYILRYFGIIEQKEGWGWKNHNTATALGNWLPAKHCHKLPMHQVIQVPTFAHGCIFQVSKMAGITEVKRPSHSDASR